MTNTNQHQMPLEHVIDNAEKAIQIAKDAEMAVRHAQLESNPKKFASAVQQLQTAQRTLEQAQSQLSAHDTDSIHQQLQQVQDQLTQAIQSADIAGDNTEQPKQVR